jgi:serine/threonine-protein kinase
MAPELLAGGSTTYKADIYSAAATLYRTLTGRHPIEAKKLNEWLAAIQTEVPPAARTVRSEIPERVSDALDRGLAKNPDKRHDSMREFRKDLGL